MLHGMQQAMQHTMQQVSQLYTEKDLQDKFSRSPRTIKKWIRKNGLLPKIGNNNKNLFTEEQVATLERYQNKLLNKSQKVSTTELVITDNQIPEKSSQVTRLPRVNSAKFFKQIYTEFSQTDPLYQYRTLQEFSDKAWRIPTNMLAIIIGVSPQSFKDHEQFSWRCFVFTKRNEDKIDRNLDRGQDLWSVEANQ